MAKLKIGLLPLYLKLYDDFSSDRRPQIEKFYRTISSELEKRGVSVITSPLCRLEPEFAAAIDSFEKAQVDAIVTLHMAYSPSLESSAVLAGTDLPIVVCDTTPAFSFTSAQEPDELMYNHGIHGVQDMCNLMTRNGKSFEIAAGHWQQSDVLDRTVEHVRSAQMASHLRRMRAGLIGKPFKGMGDFFVPADRLRNTLGVETKILAPTHYRELAASVTDEEMKKEADLDRQRFVFDDVDQAAYKRSLRTGLAVEKWLDAEGLSAFSYNFLDINRADGFDTVPFFAASKLMAKGIGFAGEGDILTATLVAALALNNPQTSFSEMFCPDWKNNSVFLSHMGEMNYELSAKKACLVEMPYKYSDADNPVFAAGRFKAGEVLLVNLAPATDHSYRLIIAPAAMLEVSEDKKWRQKIRAWLKPSIPLADFLAQYSRQAGTHHLAVTYETSVAKVAGFGRMMGWETAIIE